GQFAPAHSLAETVAEVAIPFVAIRKARLRRQAPRTIKVVAGQISAGQPARCVEAPGPRSSSRIGEGDIVLRLTPCDAGIEQQIGSKLDADVGSRHPSVAPDVAGDHGVLEFLRRPVELDQGTEQDASGERVIGSDVEDAKAAISVKTTGAVLVEAELPF